MMADDADNLFQLIRDNIASGTLNGIVLSQPKRNAECSVRRIDIRRVVIRDKECFQWSQQSGTQMFHDNLNNVETLDRLTAVMGQQYRHVQISTNQATWSGRYSKRGVCRLMREKAIPAQKSVAVEHNRIRRYLISEGIPVPFLVETGIMTSSGNVRARHFHKFRQINRYTEFIADIVDKLPAEETIRIIDFGCGKSYLTFATHYYLTTIARRKVDICGLDRRDDVIQTCQAIATRLQLKGIRFEVGDIASCVTEHPVHLAISLHACDTATDDALAQAIEWNADVILAVPCCQHELHSVHEKNLLPKAMRHGILYERFCSMSTDAIRAEVLEAAGYQTQVVEFIDMEHTAKNVLIRAVRRQNQSMQSNSLQADGELFRFRQLFGIPPLHLERTLRAKGILRTDSQSQSE
jgi:trans-aconitate methyltransferase